MPQQTNDSIAPPQSGGLNTLLTKQVAAEIGKANLLKVHNLERWLAAGETRTGSWLQNALPRDYEIMARYAPSIICRSEAESQPSHRNLKKKLERFG
jgi:hypothetical protein